MNMQLIEEILSILKKYHPTSEDLSDVATLVYEYEKTKEQLQSHIQNYELHVQANSEMAESAHYHRSEGNNQFLADYKDYEQQEAIAQQELNICRLVMKEKFSGTI